MGQRTHFLVNEVWQSVMTMEFTGPTMNYLTQKIFSLIEHRTFSWRHSYKWDIWPLRMWFVLQSYGHYILLATQQEEGRCSGTRGRNRSGSAHHYSQWPISCSFGYVFIPSFGLPSLGVLPEPRCGPSWPGSPHTAGCFLLTKGWRCLRIYAPVLSPPVPVVWVWGTQT